MSDFAQAEGHARGRALPLLQGSDPRLQQQPMAYSADKLRHKRLIPGKAEEPLSTQRDRKSTRLNSSHLVISYAVFCLKKKKKHEFNLIIIAYEVYLIMRLM